MNVYAGQRISHDQVDLWWENIDSHEAGIPELWRILTEEERSRAQRFRLEKHQRRFILRHGMLREILGRYLEMAPEEVRLRNGPGGKPAVAGEDPMIRFNLSDSGGYALYAVARGREVGVDVEVIRSKPKAAALMNRFFSANEKAAFQKLGADEQVSAFFAGWTRKEAYVKAIGKGLRFSLDRFDVSLKSGDQNALLNVAGAFKETSRWLLRDIDLGPDFRAALAVEIAGKCPGKDISIRFRRYHP
jgi:4'-phosphopantetheinyl transferase